MKSILDKIKKEKKEKQVVVASRIEAELYDKLVALCKSKKMKVSEGLRQILKNVLS